MASKRKRQPEKGPQELELAEPDDVLGQEEAMGGIEEEVAPEADARPRPRRTAKTRAPRQSSIAPAPRQRAPRREGSKRRDPRQLSLFSRLAPERVSQRVTYAGGSILISLLGLGGLVILFYFFAGSRFFTLKGVDVRWPALGPGAKPLLSADEVEAMVRPHAPRGVLNADLEEIREELEKYPLIRDAQVSRLLPDRLRVSIIERRPVALVRRGDSVVCVDDEGVMFGDRSHWRGGDAPLINGLVESGEGAKEINRQRVMMYKRLMADLDQSEPPLSSRVDEICVDQDEGVRLRLADKREWVLIGKEDFRTRLNAALDVLDAVRRKDMDALNVLKISDAERLLGGARIAYLNATDPKRVIVGLDE